MSHLPVIVGIGGVNPAGRVSCHHAYRRLVIDQLPEDQATHTWESLAALMQVDGESRDPKVREHMRANTLVRRIDASLLDVDAIPWQRSAQLGSSTGDTLTLRLRRRHMPDVVPANWQVSDVPDQPDMVDINAAGGMDVLLADQRVSRVQSAGMLPSGFDPAALYQARSHPRGLQLAIYGASDAIQSLGISWEHIRQVLRPDQMGTYAGSAMAQLDSNGYAGMMQAGMTGKRVTAKQLPLGLPEMVADFVNAYVLGSVGTTGCNIGACATFLYNLRMGVDDIRSGRRRLVVVGNAEAPITAEVIEGYRTMGALAEDEALAALDGPGAAVNHRRACRPFADNCGFTLAESGIFTVLMDDALALELGATVLGGVGDVFVHADGYKKSIPGPGVGNYLTVAKAMAVARAMFGNDALRQRSFIQAHGTSTPQNRVTESHIFSQLAGVFGIDSWTVAAMKAYLGHSLAPASGDQLAMTLGAFQHGIIPGITTVETIAADVHQEHLHFPLQHHEVGAQGMDMAFLNSKGFGGNNATALVLAPHVVESMLTRRHGKAAMTAWRRRNEAVQEATAAYDLSACRGEARPIYRFGEGVVDGDQLEISSEEIRIPGFGTAVKLDEGNPYPDMVGD